MNILRTKGSTLSISICVDISYPDVNYLLDGKTKIIRIFMIFYQMLKQI